MVYSLHLVPRLFALREEQEHSLRSLAQPRKRGPLSLEQPKRIIAWEAKAGPKGGRPKGLRGRASCLLAALEDRKPSRNTKPQEVRLAAHYR